MPAPIVPLDRRIADALVAKSHDLDDITALLKEVDETAGSVEAERTYSMARSLDPTVVDPDARDRATKAEHMLARLNNAKPRVQKIHDDLIATQKLKEWNADLAKLVAIRDEVAQKFRDRYSACAQEIIQLFDWVAEVDKQIDALNNRAYAAGARQRCRLTEAAARGVDDLATVKTIASQVKLPLFGLGSGDPGLAWPRPAAPIALHLMAAMPGAAPDAELQAAFETGGNEGYVAALRKRDRDRADRLVEQGQQAERIREQRNAEAADAARAARR